jgi:hypothetical protein
MFSEWILMLTLIDRFCDRQQEGCPGHHYDDEYNANDLIVCHSTAPFQGGRYFRSSFCPTNSIIESSSAVSVYAFEGEGLPAAYLLAHQAGTKQLHISDFLGASGRISISRKDIEDHSGCRMI